MQDADVQEQCNANNTAEPGVNINPIMNPRFQEMNNYNNSNKSFLSEEIRKDYMKTKCKRRKLEKQ